MLSGWPLHSNGTTLHGPYLGPDGWMYLTYNLGRYNIQTKEGTTLRGPGGRVFRFRPDGSGLEWIIGGCYDNGIEMVFTDAGEMIGTMTYYRNPQAGKRLWRVNSPDTRAKKFPASNHRTRIVPAPLFLLRKRGYKRNMERGQNNRLSDAQAADVIRDDRRVDRRYEVRLELRYKLPASIETGRTCSGTAHNLSRGGVLVEADEALPPGVAVELTVKWPFRLQNVCPLDLVIVGQTIRSDGARTAVRTVSYSFRTRGARSFEEAPDEAKRVLAIA